MKKIIIYLYALFSFNCIAKSAETGGMPQLNPEFWFSQIFWLTITFGILFIILSKFILPKIRNNLETRKSQIMENIEIADNQKTNSEKNLKEYDKIISTAKIQRLELRCDNVYYKNDIRDFCFRERCMDKVNTLRVVNVSYDSSF